MLTQEQIKAIVQDFYGHMLEQDNRIRLKEGRITPELRQQRIEYYRWIADRTREDLGSNNFGSALTTSMAMVSRHGLKSLTPEELDQIRQALLRGGIDLADAIRARYEGDFNFEPKDKLLVAKLDAAFGGTPPIVQPAPSAEPPPEPQPNGVTFRKRAAQFVTKQKQRKKWKEQTIAQNKKSYELFADICGDRPVRAYQRKDAARFKEKLELLPAEYGKAARYAGKSVEEVLRLDEAEGGQGERLSIRTVKRHISALSALWDDCELFDEVDQNLFSGLKFPQQQRAQDQRPMWSRDDLARLFMTPVWAGCSTEHRRSHPGKLIIRDEKFWLPLIAVFSGARQEEICQLHVEDIRQAEGVWVFDINQKPPRKLKNKSAVRLVPVHDELLRLGLLDYIEERKRAGDSRLFPNLQPGGADGRLGHGYTKWFTRYRRDVKVYEPGRDFHSFRHSASTFLHQGGASDSLVDRLTGHTTPGETSRYTKSSRIMQLKQAINSIDIGVSLTHLYPKTD